MPHRREQRARLGADAVRRGLVSDELRMFGLESPQLDDECVVVGVWDLRFVVLEIRLVVSSDLGAKLLDPWAGVAHGQAAASCATIAVPTTRSWSIGS